MKILALLLNIAGIAALLGSGLMVMMSPMLFDAPDSSKNKLVWVVFTCFLLMPVLLLLGQIMGWRNFMKGEYLSSIYAYKWALLDLVVIVVVFALMSKVS
jgi:hypothetical protein